MLLITHHLPIPVSDWPLGACASAVGTGQAGPVTGNIQYRLTCLSMPSA